jgi:hypothetical protein
MSGTQPQPNSGTVRDDEAERMESGSAGKEHKCLDNKHECPESENKRHGRIAPDDQDDDNGCI